MSGKLHSAGDHVGDVKSPSPRILSKSQDVGKSGHWPPHPQPTLKRDDPIADFHKQPRRWLHVDQHGQSSYVTVGFDPHEAMSDYQASCGCISCD